MSKRSLYLFLLTLLGATWALQFVALQVVGDVASDQMTLWLVAAMFFPAIWSLVYGFTHRDSLKVVMWRPGRLAALIVAPLIPAVLAMSVLGVCLAAGWGISSYFEFPATGVNVLKGPWLLGLGDQNWVTFVGNIALTSMVYGLFNALATVGEEFGWRGFLQPHLINLFGVSKGVLLLGAVWALWHLPVLLAGYNYPEYPILGAFVLFPISLIAASFILAALTIWARSFWPAVLFHGSINGAYDGIVTSIVTSTGTSRLTVDVTAICVEVALGAVCWRLLMRRWQKAGKAGKAGTPTTFALR